ncbi:hypothetical protein [Herbaspirillum huttiense]|uniref:hypothetical protein n=1 Tax=Herbaspirillum huttiense TaxID=863372 RepID=UPI0039B03EA9
MNPIRETPPEDLLSAEECILYRDKLRAARYSALADSEGFDAVCFALEELGMRLLRRQADMNTYRERIGFYASKSCVFDDLVEESSFKSFNSLYDIVRRARNDSMHQGAYARHATTAAIELCIGLEEGLMAVDQRLVKDVMVGSVVVVEKWHLIAQARKLMLMHSFSFLPIFIDCKWHLISELALAKFLQVASKEKSKRLGMNISDAAQSGLTLIPVSSQALLRADMNVEDVLSRANIQLSQVLWLIPHPKIDSELLGVLSPFELM